MIEVRHTSKQLGGKRVLDDISVVFERGKTNLVIGASGSGKTVLMKCIVGLLKVDSGNIFFDEREFSAMKPSDLKHIRQEIGMLFQGGAMFDSLTVEQNVMFPLSMFTDQTLAQRRERAEYCLQKVNLEGIGHLYPSELSGGMKKRVAIARAIALNPRYLFCDEPNSGLDPQTANVIDRLIHDLTREFGMTTVVNTHDMNSVIEIGDKIAFLYQGKVWWEGSNKEIFHTENPELNHFVFATELTRRLRKEKP